MGFLKVQSEGGNNFLKLFNAITVIQNSLKHLFRGMTLFNGIKTNDQRIASRGNRLNGNPLSTQVLVKEKSIG